MKRRDRISKAKAERDNQREKQKNTNNWIDMNRTCSKTSFDSYWNKMRDFISLYSK